jgi:hypothetical protein
MVTTDAARALMLQDRRGRIAVGYDADLMALPDRGQDLYTTLIDAQPGDVALVVCRGVPVYGDVTFRTLFEQYTAEFSQVLVSGRPKLVAGDLPSLLRTLSTRAGRILSFPFLPCTFSDRSTADHDL